MLKLRKLRNKLVWVIRRSGKQVGPYFGSKQLAVTHLKKVIRADWARFKKQKRKRL